jgi:hypothetical protein
MAGRRAIPLSRFRIVILYRDFVAIWHRDLAPRSGIWQPTFRDENYCKSAVISFESTNLFENTCNNAVIPSTLGQFDRLSAGKTALLHQFPDGG